MAAHLVLSLTVQVAALNELRHLVWHTSEDVTAMLSDELVQSCDEVSAILRAHSTLIARYIYAAAPRFERFRILARERDSGTLVGYHGKVRSKETGAFLPMDDETHWTACPHDARCPQPVSLTA